MPNKLIFKVLLLLIVLVGVYFGFNYAFELLTSKTDIFWVGALMMFVILWILSLVIANLFSKPDLNNNSK
jgi:nitrogen fixation/metabolism regulation signal transduction histidine kinase